jgi:hypothetical protein
MASPYDYAHPWLNCDYISYMTYHEDAWYDRLNANERKFVDLLHTAWFKTRMAELDYPDEGFMGEMQAETEAIYCLDIRPRRVYEIERECREHFDKRMEDEGKLARNACKMELTSVMREHKQMRKIGKMDIIREKMELNIAYKRARSAGVTHKQVFDIVKRIARKFRVHSAMQLWRRCSVDVGYLLK